MMADRITKTNTTMKVIRETYSKWGTMIQSTTIEGTTLKKMATKYNAAIETNGKSFSINIDGQRVKYRKP
jgi:hypothetical protein